MADYKFTQTGAQIQDILNGANAIITKLNSSWQNKSLTGLTTDIRSLGLVEASEKKKALVTLVIGYQNPSNQAYTKSIINLGIFDFNGNVIDEANEFFFPAVKAKGLFNISGSDIITDCDLYCSIEIPQTIGPSSVINFKISGKCRHGDFDIDSSMFSTNSLTLYIKELA